MPTPFNDPERDWPQDAVNDPDNGAYFNRCFSCGEMFTGHKRRHYCRKCSDESQARWNAMTLAEKKAAVRKLRAALGTVKL